MTPPLPHPLRAALGAAVLAWTVAGTASAATTTPEVQPFSVSITQASAAFEEFVDVTFQGFDTSLGTLTGVLFALDVETLSSNASQGTPLPDDQGLRIRPQINVPGIFASSNTVFEGQLPFITSTTAPDDLDATRTIDETDIGPVLFDRWDDQAEIDFRFQIENPNAFRDGAVAGTFSIAYEFDPAAEPEINRIPLPAGLWLALTGLAGLVVAARRARVD
ncbi:MAG: VPLPA-CTERM sorting domain-containing protein [Paracoccaceae bacterium]